MLHLSSVPLIKQTKHTTLTSTYTDIQMGPLWFYYIWIQYICLANRISISISAFGRTSSRCETNDYDNNNNNTNQKVGSAISCFQLICCRIYTIFFNQNVFSGCLLVRSFCSLVEAGGIARARARGTKSTCAMCVLLLYGRVFRIERNKPGQAQCEIIS